VTLRFLGTGASSGTPGTGRSHRLESSLFVESGGTRILIDVTRHFTRQSARVKHLDAVLLTHAHRDASGGVAQLREWWLEHGREPLPVYAGEGTLAMLEGRYKRLDHCRLVTARAGSRLRVDGLTVVPLDVPHARNARFPTFAWKLLAGGTALVYASDVAELTPELERFCRGASLLVIDGAMWKRRIFSHLTIDETLPALCEWKVERIVLTQLGRSVPSHDELARETARICARAQPAYDGMELAL
jgi:phosphoribosyl 1,2-cyclic phosphate phosphodiesterase